MSSGAHAYLSAGLPAPVPEPDGLSAPYWEGLRRGELLLQRCDTCNGWQWGPEWLCHRCHSFDVGWRPVEARGTLFSGTRSWHPAHPALKEHGPYIFIVVELPQAGGIRLVGNLLGDPKQDIRPGSAVEGVFEHHAESDPPFSLLQWKYS